ncbi:MAG TPA: maltotransferase domain-containing protein, partial [Candidatus Dormibacteraeota bacterium]|nr:maltotransferase domain-containing protein [Candidatus Dormibacteraeota bacterium]
MQADRRRVVVDRVRPIVDCGDLPAKATVGLPLRVSGTLALDGHDPLLAWAWYGRGAAQPLADAGCAPRGWREVRLEPAGNDVYSTWVVIERPGDWAFAVGGMPDEYGGWLRDLRIRIEAGQEVEVELQEGAAMARRRLQRDGLRDPDRRALEGLSSVLGERGAASKRLRAAERQAAIDVMRRTADRSAATVAGAFPLWADRELAGMSAWYEMFPRSEGATPTRGGTFATASERLPALAGMGFDVVYLPPVHPIGTTFRKGRNNTLEPGPDDPGSPWAIGGKAGGHDALHPDLGTLADFDRFVASAKKAGLEVALDYALQCSPDHPWVKQHPQWFRHRVDGTIRYAENPPKRYQDIYPFDFDSEDATNLWNALRDVMLQWVRHGVRIFRVDNPHTKPFRFWRWLIAEVHKRHPDVLFLAEAFTRPAVMQHLAKIGFSQSYTYFTWRNSKWELSEYLHELSQTEQVDWFRPNFWVNTPDILHATLQRGGPAAFRLRAVLAAITCPSWGMYSGYELFENTPLREGSEEYLDSEKYQLKPRIWNQPHTLAPFITRLNEIRRRHRAAIAQLDTLRLHHVGNEAMLCVSRSSVTHDDVLLLVANLDPFTSQEATTWLDLQALGIAADRPFEARDELTGASYLWQG